MPAGDDLVAVAMDFTTRGVCTLWPQLLQRDILSRYRLRGLLYNRLIDYQHGFVGLANEPLLISFIFKSAALNTIA